MKRSVLYVIAFATFSCSNSNNNLSSKYLESSLESTVMNDEPKKILDPAWYEGKSEISVYELKQNRYNGVHDGEAVMIFVTEDFLKDKQVKNDNYTSKFSTPILKNNQIRKFATGLYDYSMFTSVFTEAIDTKNNNTLKITTSSQDWCGQSFLQINKQERSYKIRGFSYFENEGDTDKTIDKNLIVDEIFNLIRMDDEKLPIGNLKAIPSTVYNRLKHQKLKSYEAKAIKIPYQGSLTNEAATVYVIKFPELNLKYEFIYLNNNLRDILQWKESYPSAFDGQVRETVATRKSNQWVDYWNKNNVKDSTLRQGLKLTRF